jgi:hypothetical protein
MVVGRRPMVDCMVGGREQVSLIEKWRLRHAYPDAVGAWANATGADAREFAFNAIAQDPRVLRRAARPQAIKLAAQAEDFALSLRESGAAKSETWREAALFVQRSIRTWRLSLKSYDHHFDGLTVSAALPAGRETNGDPWETARRNFPFVNDETGSLATRLLHEFGGSILERARKPWDQVIALSVLRYAARLLRGELHDGASGRVHETAVADVLTVQSYAEAVSISPMLVGYSGPGRPVEQALSLLRDARTLRDAMGEVLMPVWQRVIDFHAYAIVAMDHRVLLDLPLEDAYELATAAARQAEAALATPGLIEMPRLPRGIASNPDVVRLDARACLPKVAE